MTFSLGFRPAYNKHGQVKLTYKGSEKFTDVKEIISGFTGELKQITCHYVILKFDCMGGLARKSSGQLDIVVSPTLDDGLKLTEIVYCMGYKGRPFIHQIHDNDYETGIHIGDGYNFDETDVCPTIKSFLKSCEGKHYLATLTKATEGDRKGYYDIVADSLQPFNK